MVRLVELLSAEECERARGTILELRPRWHESELDFQHDGRWYQERQYTVGITSYVEARRDPLHYRALAGPSNALLREHLGWAYDRLLAVVEEATGRPARYDDGFAMPGFHVFFASKAFELPIAPIHFDGHYQHIDWSGHDVSFAETLSFTAAIALPTGGGGMNMWNLTRAELAGRSEQEAAALVEASPCTYLPYRVGAIALHSGALLHQIAPLRGAVPGEARITLQGHGVVADGAWLLYW